MEQVSKDLLSEDDKHVKRRKAIKTVRRALEIARALDPFPQREFAQNELSYFTNKLCTAWGKTEDSCSARFRVLLFHYPLPADSLTYRSGDLKMDLSEINFEWVIERTIRNLLATIRECEVVLVTDHFFLGQLHFDRLRVVRLELDPLTPMYNRVALYNAYVNSEYFRTRTALLDSDIFVLRPFDSLYLVDFDIAVTFRSAANFMSLNEGVILISPNRIEAVRNWFFTYFNIYCTLASNDSIQEVYPSIKRWRGGQLSLNLVCGGQYFYQTKIESIQGARVAFLPCSLLNRTLDEKSAGDPTLLKNCYGLHLKGARKRDIKALDQLLERQRVMAQQIT